MAQLSNTHIRLLTGVSLSGAVLSAALLYSVCNAESDTPPLSDSRSADSPSAVSDDSRDEALDGERNLDDESEVDTDESDTPPDVESSPDDIEDIYACLSGSWISRDVASIVEKASGNASSAGKVLEQSGGIRVVFTPGIDRDLYRIEFPGSQGLTARVEIPLGAGGQADLPETGRFDFHIRGSLSGDFEIPEAGELVLLSPDKNTTDMGSTLTLGDKTIKMPNEAMPQEVWTGSMSVRCTDTGKLTLTASNDDSFFNGIVLKREG